MRDVRYHLRVDEESGRLLTQLRVDVHKPLSEGPQVGERRPFVLESSEIPNKTPSSPFRKLTINQLASVSGINKNMVNQPASQVRKWAIPICTKASTLALKSVKCGSASSSSNTTVM